MAQYSANTSHNNSYTLRLTVEETNVNNTNNTSDVNWALDFITTSSGYNGNIRSISCSIAGQTVFSETNKTHNYSTHNKTYSIGSGTVTGIAHDNDGTKTINVSASIDTPTGAVYSPGYASINENFTLTNIPRVSVLNSFTMTISSDGNSVTVTPSITKQNNSYYDVLKLSGNTPIAMIGGVTNNVSKNLSSSSINTLYQTIGTSTGANVIGWLSTYTSQSGTAIGDSAIKSYFVSLPSYSLSNTITVTDNVTTYNTYKNNTSDLIANLSQPNLVFSATSSTGSTYGRAITHTINNEASTSPKTINNYMGGSFTLVSTDGRKTTTTTSTNTVIPYQRPTISCKLERTSATSDTASVTITGKYYDGNGLKTSALLTRSIVLKYTETGEAEQTISNFTINETTSNHVVSYTATATLSNLDYRKGISYVAIITDLIGVTNDANGSIPEGQPVWNAYRDSNGTNHMVINGIFETQYGKTIIPKPYIEASCGSSSQTVGQTWTKIAFDYSAQRGDIFSFDSANNVIIVPKGIKKIRVWGAVGGRYGCWAAIYYGSDKSTSNKTRSEILVQPTGNGFFGAALPTIDVDIKTQYSEAYLSLKGFAYGGNNVVFNDGLPYTTRICVELLELY